MYVFKVTKMKCKFPLTTTRCRNKRILLLKTSNFFCKYTTSTCNEDQRLLQLLIHVHMESTSTYRSKTIDVHL